MRRVAALLVAASISSLAFGLFAGPASAAAKVTDCKKDKKLNPNITKALDAYLTGATSADQMKFVQNGAKIVPFSEQSRQEAAAKGQTSADTKTLTFGLKATCDGKKAATFTYDLALNVPKSATTTPTKGAGLNFSGDAVLDTKKGVWLISALTICDLLGGGDAALGQQCAQAAG
jgi:hypothetical protein